MVVVARVPSVVATMIYAIPPGIRLTELGLRQVSPPVVEAARAFGATRHAKEQQHRNQINKRRHGLHQIQNGTQYLMHMHMSRSQNTKGHTHQQ